MLAVTTMARVVNCLSDCIAVRFFSLGCIAAALSGVGGCANQQGMSNPFTTADRVPPPTTQFLQPGAGQPYYQGDPLPPLPQGGFQQGALQAPPAAFAQAQPAQPIQDATAQRVVQAAYNEPAVAIPNDNSDLRMAYVPPTPPAPAPAAQPRPIQPQASQASGLIAAAPAAREVVTIPAPQQVFPQQAPAQTALPTRPVQLAVVNTPAAARPGVSAPMLPQFTDAARSTDGLPWVSGSAPRLAPQPARVASQPATFVAPASYAAAPRPVVRVAAATPRVRLPGYPAPQQTFVTPATGVPSPPPNMGRVQITELPAQTYAAPATAAPTTSSTDGFRARESRFGRQAAARPTF